MIEVYVHGFSGLTAMQLTTGSGHSFESVAISARDGSKVKLLVSREELSELFIALTNRMVEIREKELENTASSIAESVHSLLTTQEEVAS